MPTPAQAGAAVAVVGVLSAGGYGAYYFTSSGEQTEAGKEGSQSSTTTEPKPSSFLSKDDLNKSPYQGTILSVFKDENIDKFVNPSDTKNEPWFTWKIKDIYEVLKTKQQLDSDFTNVTSGSDLAKKCSAALSKGTDRYQFPENNYFLLNVASLCAQGTTKDNVVAFWEPKTPVSYSNTEATSPYNYGLTSINENQTNLVKTLEIINKHWWLWAYETRVRGVDVSNRSPEFKSVSQGYSDTDIANPKTSLNKACDDVYKRRIAPTEEALINNIKAFCTLDKTTLTVKDIDAEPGEVEVLVKTSLTTDGYTDGVVVTKMKESNLQYIVKPVSTTKDKNQKWWDWAFTNKFQVNKGYTALSAPFNTVSKAYSDSDDNTALNQACKTAYKKTDYTFNNTLFDDIKKFCTKTLAGHDVSEPESSAYNSMQNTGGYELGILTNGDANATKLIDVTTASTNNDLWFKWAFEKRLPKDRTTLSSPFSSVTKPIKEDNDNPDTSLKHACEEAYKKDKYFLSDDNDKLLTEIGKFCASTIFKPTLPNVEVEKEPTTDIKTFSAQEEITNPEYKGKIISLTKKTNREKIVKHDHKNNRSWWDWAFKKLWEAKKTTNSGKLHTIFTELTKGYSDKPTETKALNQACHTAYQQGESEYKFGTTEYLLKNIGQFCTKGTEDSKKDVSEPEPTFMTEEEIKKDPYAKGIFKGEEGKKNREHLVSVTGGKNELWWKWAHENLWKNKNTNANSHFKENGTTITAYSSTSNGSGSKALNQICDAAYRTVVSELIKEGTTPTIFDGAGSFCKSGSGTLTTVKA